MVLPLILLWYAVFAGVLFATLKFGASAEIKFKTLFALVIYSSLPGILKALLAIVSLLAGVAGDGFTFKNPVATNPGYFVDPAGIRFCTASCRRLMCLPSGP